MPIHRVMDRRAKCTPEQLRRFSSTMWPEAVRDFGRCGIQFQISDATGEIKRSAADRPIFAGLDRGKLNLVLTDRIPMFRDKGRALAGVTTIYENYRICAIAFSYAHGHRITFLSVNTCVHEHEILHAPMPDIFVRRAEWFETGERETRVDGYASCLWLFHGGAAIRKSAQVYVARFQSAVATADARTSALNIARPA